MMIEGGLQTMMMSWACSRSTMPRTPQVKLLICPHQAVDADLLRFEGSGPGRDEVLAGSVGSRTRPGSALRHVVELGQQRPLSGR